MIMQIIHFLNSENYEFEDNDENFILFFIQKSQLLTNLTEFFETNNENFILSIFHFFISLSVLSGDYIDFLIPHFKNIEFIIVFLKPGGFEKTSFLILPGRRSNVAFLIFLKNIDQKRL